VRGLPPIFRLTHFSQPRELDSALSRRGYELIDRTWVMTKDLADLDLRNGPGNVQRISTSAWLDVFDSLGLLDPHAMSTRRQIVERASDEAIPLVALDGDRILGLNLGVRTDTGLGLFGLYVIERARRRELGSALVRAALTRGREAGARTAYLQVEESNSPARALYQKLGFADAYAYWYRISS